MLIERFKIRITYSNNHALYSLRINAANDALLTHYTLQSPQARIFYIKPDEQHLLMMREWLADGIMFPFHTFESNDVTHSATG